MEIPMITISQYNDIVADKEKCFLIFTKQKCSVRASDAKHSEDR